MFFSRSVFTSSLALTLAGCSFAEPERKCCPSEGSPADHVPVLGIRIRQTLSKTLAGYLLDQSIILTIFLTGITVKTTEKKSGVCM
ncbi:hypothetical protein T439DRAFT_125263 [Meredithblackwellia eburnea MCA 4105]